ncbi:putative lysosomal cobalamin transporter [Fulvia fulva]|uniref:Probable lysosomal cobalamin transporter n=1 Tax=Passalora fulva TaxID=5499 RepID=A0A9Q8P6E9_PASFU|nr:putative lysosomal cobalamin transporter [Fulvia fulva]KAK4628992.1 putative lysosomal cobalamin transporter [Fulvia fulva]KAK4630455.1 putative lysosomal cobalamin transporter [Fulvia fulva]UJO14953.1 putative lysosomal cobalamin transporter [Fulvia fulva]WPV12479.1 putative lysosomal cobalamin transporter [Fulvia fulva]WPV27586.1 putative lysosomal cobalamin transporter [Fulvia fulva]
MALIETSLIWVTYAVCLAIIFFISAIFVFVYQKPGERTVAVTIICWITVLALLATVLLMPVDIALVSSTTARKLGRKKDWATPDKVDDTIHTLKIVYYTLYSLDAVLCLLVVPFTYFYYEAYDEGQQTVADRLWSAFKWTFSFLLLCVILFLVGFFVPVAKKARDEHKDLDYFKDLLTENHGERALTFSIGVLMLVGTILYCLYTAPGLALLPVSLIKSAPRVSAPQLAENTSSQLAQNQERQRQLELRGEGREGGLDPRDRRELEALNREERTLRRRERLASENSGEGANFFIRVWLKLEAIFRPLKLIFGLLIGVITLIIFASMLITMVDKIKNSVCGVSCGYLLGKTKIFQPVNALLTHAARVFPIDYIIFLLLTLLFFGATVVGLATIGIRILWVTLFKIRKGHTTPNAMLMATVLLTLMVLALNYSLAMVVAPTYATFGPQTFCDRPSHTPDLQPDCSKHHKAIRPCSERTDNPVAKMVCTPTVISTFLNRITANFPYFGVVDFYAQFAFLGIFIIVFIVTLFRVPKLDEEQLDDDLREEEEEGLLASTGRRFGATWQDITGRPKGVRRSDYGAVSNRDGAAEDD